MEIRKEMLVGWPAHAMFDLIEQAENYPAFLPWCASATILERSDDVVAAALAVDYRGVKFGFSTRNPKRRPEWLRVQLVSGPFRRFEGEWQLAPLGDAGCRVVFMLRYEFDSTVMQRLASPVFDRIADTLLDALVSHADRHFAVTPPVSPAATSVSPVPPTPTPTLTPTPTPVPVPVLVPPTPTTAGEGPPVAAAVPPSEPAPRNLPTPTTIPAAPDPASFAPAAAAPAASPSPDPSTRSPE
jgi:ribosome-associated toxin RatA of RatAB toxin-antitoxin module